MKKAEAEVARWVDHSRRTGAPLEKSYEHIVADVVKAFAEDLQPDPNGWLPIASLPQGRHVMLYWAHGERGGGGVECAMVFYYDGFDGDWYYWSHGGPNSGWDWTPANDEKPTHWKPYLPPSRSPLV